jgi:hypothetical protein
MRADMRSLFLFLLLANLLFAAAQFDLFGPLLHPVGTRVEAIQPEKLRLVRGGNAPRAPTPRRAAPATSPATGPVPSTE